MLTSCGDGKSGKVLLFEAVGGLLALTLAVCAALRHKHT